MSTKFSFTISELHTFSLYEEISYLHFKTMKKIPCNEQSLLCASTQINSQSIVVSELIARELNAELRNAIHIPMIVVKDSTPLHCRRGSGGGDAPALYLRPRLHSTHAVSVFNSLDAGATSIAVRVNIQENTIQVVDNGIGISIKNVNCIGQKHMTSKYIDVSTLKSAPNMYGCRGQALANIISVSKCVMVTSRPADSEEAWVKLFKNGTEETIKYGTTRPSKGITVEIRGFLYNLPQKPKDILGEIQSIKRFLEHLSLVHSNISLSLRDDSKNEIIFKMHKNRDIYQTLSTLYGFNKNSLQELQVEKGEYKVKAYIGNFDGIGKHIIFLNGKFIWNQSKLHETVNNNFRAYLKLRGVFETKIKNKNVKEDPENLIQNSIPDYIMFISCPYNDYDLSSLPKQYILEFKDWGQINKLLKKVITFFKGDLKKVVKKFDNNLTKKKMENTDTKERVKKIMEQILGTHSKKPGVSSMHKAIKAGKQAKRKFKLSLKTTTLVENTKENGSSSHVNDVILEHKPDHLNEIKDCYTTNKQIDDNYAMKERSKAQCLVLNTVNKNSIVKLIKKCDNESKSPQTNIEKKEITKKRKINTEKNTSFMFNTDTNSLRRKYFQRLSNKKIGEKNETEIIELRSLRPKINENMLIEERDKEKLKFKQLILQKDIATRHDNATNSEHHANMSMKNNLVLSNFDLLRTILNTQGDNNVQNKNVNESNNITVVMDPPRVTEAAIVNDKHKMSKIVRRKNNISDSISTYKSHNYLSHQFNNTKNNQNHDSHIHIRNQHKSNIKGRSGHFITKQSQDNFLVPNLNDVVRKRNLFKKKITKTKISKQFHSHIEKLFEKSSKLFDLKKQIIGNTNESSFTIKFTESNICESTNIDMKFNDVSRNSIVRMEKMLHYASNRNYGTSNNIHSSMNYGTNTVANVESDNCQMNEQTNWHLHDTYTIEETNEAIYNSKPQNQGDTINDNTMNFIFVSKSQVLDRDDGHNIQPITICETVTNSNQIIEKEFGLSFNDNQNKILINTLALSKENKNNEITEDGDKNIQGISAQNEVSHHFNLKMNLEDIASNVNEINDNTMNFIFVSKSQELDIDDDHDIQPISVCETVMNSHNPSSIITTRQNVIGKHLMEKKKPLQITNELNIDGFNFLNRMCFLPKGMSPIFQNCQTKSVCDYNLSKDYYEKEIYNNFAADVRCNAEIFKPKIQEVQEINTKDIDKANAKMNKNDSDLKFNRQSLRNAKILGQIDDKFIAVTMKECDEETLTDYLVLFDQHAVHERIRLEDNLNDYFFEEKWKPAKIDEFSLLLSKDYVMYLHNYKEKFEQLGLIWTVKSPNVISIAAIPEAILGKSPRQVEKVIKAVKNLIIEEINVIKTQGGTIFLYPKSIMDLVFSEACRNAIKFGDKLLNSECVELLKTLSDCKTPFQCAHGRPVMAVIIEIKANHDKYKINIDKISKWKRK